MVPHEQWRRGVEAREGEFAALPYDRTTVERFREAFPRARWNDERKSWFVPGKTAARRIERWLARESEHTDIHGDLKGRDAYDFEPIVSRYLEVSDDLRIRTPYSRSVIELLREISWTHWDEDMGGVARTLPVLRRTAATLAHDRGGRPSKRTRRRKRRRDAEKGLRGAKGGVAGIPLTTDDPPPLGRPVATVQDGIVTFLDFLGEVAEPAALAQYYHQADQAVDHVWGRWRRPTFAELVATWPARKEPGPEALSRGWWQPMLAELRIARRNARSMARRQQARKPAGVAAHRTRAE
ncbi:hypothetical protein EV184_10610 [Sinorhizobium americanum]|uniref:Uncharacterized protein n=1 Tax=Sinorhizobium americanum TaxID=194963 RepID=A0A4R2BTY9_9HYPH|nr:hypothetical protein [Sinorhizobium americanum]TCN31238.1 hypothetical protein EV184_10610 [Sinorhizobium americanum]